MTFTFLRNLLRKDNLDRAIKNTMLMIRIVLWICILISGAFLVIVVFSKGNIDYGGIGALFAYTTFYSLIWGAFPSLFLLIIIALANKYLKKTRLQPIKTETILWVINLIIILIAGTIIQVSYFS